MESFSTSPRALVPWVANLATLVVVVSAAWWSGANRPAPEPAESARLVPAALPADAPQTGALPTATTPRPGGKAPGVADAPAWPLQTTTATVEGMQTVVFSPARR